MTNLQNEHRLSVLEIELRNVKVDLSKAMAEISEMEDRLSYYDRMAMKWGGVAIGALSLFAAIGMGADKLKDKVLAWFTP